MATGEDVVREARKWLGTPFMHQARVVGEGVDCVGVPIGIALALGFAHEDQIGYSRLPDGYSLKAAMDRQLVQVPNREAGDLLVFKQPKRPRHVGVYIGNGYMIHADANVGKVVECTLDVSWLRTLVKTYRFRELTA